MTPVAPRLSRSGTWTPPRTGGRRRGSPTRGRAPPTSEGRARWSRSVDVPKQVPSPGSASRSGDGRPRPDSGPGAGPGAPRARAALRARLDLGEQGRERIGDVAPEREILCGERLEPGGRTRGHDASLPPGYGRGDRAPSEQMQRIRTTAYCAKGAWRSAGCAVSRRSAGGESRTDRPFDRSSGSVAARHPAGGTTRRRIGPNVGGPFDVPTVRAGRLGAIGRRSSIRMDKRP